MGKLIVFEGGDGTGKATQAKKLIEYLKKNNISYDTLDFPQYDSFYGKIVAQFLRGEFGALDEVSPYLASLTFAMDRLAAKKTIIKKLEDNKIVVANRYVTSNIAHQTSKFKDKKEADTFIKWIEKLEYVENGLPKEDLVIYLSLPATLSSKLILQKNKRDYLKGKKTDIQESNLDYIRNTNNLYENLAKRYPNWEKINCAENGTIRSVESIAEEVIDLLKVKNIL